MASNQPSQKETNKKNTVWTNANVDRSSPITVAPIIHHSQSLQLCAIHALNNLLQLTPDRKVDKTDTENNINQEFILCSGKLYQHPSMDAGSQEEFNRIADELTRKEHVLYSDIKSNLDPNALNINENEIKDGSHHVSFWQILRSHHRTPLFGNYSFEVLEVALLKRNVKLQWCTDINLALNDSIRINDSGLCEITIGFIINTFEPLSIWNAFTRPFRRSRHWYAVTNVRRVINYDPGNARVRIPSTMSVFGNRANHEKDENSWHVIDSLSKKVTELNNDGLKQLFYDIEQKGGSIMIAIMTKLSPFE